MLKISFTCMMLVCAVGLLALSGHGDSGQLVLDTVPPVVKVLAPDGGEIWYLGFTFDILWSSYDSNPQANTISLSYSTDGGASYASILDNTANDGNEPWLVPMVPTTAALVRIGAVDAFGNTGQDVSLAPFSLEYVPPQPPGGVNVDTSNDLDAVLSWLPVTETTYNTPITPDGYIILYCENPSPSIHDYFFLGETDGLTYTHEDVVQFRSQMYYRVVAYVDMDGRISSLLKTLEQNPQPRLSLADILVRLSRPQGGAR